MLKALLFSISVFPMPEEPIHQPHDKLFKSSFSDPINAAAFLRTEISPALSEQIAWPCLRLEPGSFVDSQFRHSESDLLFSAPLLDTECLLYLLFEHQSSEEPALALRLLRYMVRIWESIISKPPLSSSKSGRPLPVILPVVLAQNGSVWKLQPNFINLVDLPAGLEPSLQSFIPDFTFRLIQLANLPFESIVGTPAGIMTLRVMKAERMGGLLSDVVWDEAMMEQLPTGILECLLAYILGADIDNTDFERRIATVIQPKLQTAVMSLAEQLRQQGHQQGQQQGRQEGVANGLKKAIVEVLEIRFLSIPAGLLEAIEAIHEESRLSALHRAAIRASTLEDFTAAF